MKIFKVVVFISLILIIAVAAMSVIGVSITGFYPGMIVLLLLTLIPITSNLYAKKINSKSNNSQGKYYITLTIINLLSMLIVLWMTFVILIDRVIPNI